MTIATTGKGTSLEDLIRLLPDPQAPPPPLSQNRYTVVTWLVYLVYLSIVPIYIPYLILLHLLLPRPFPSWTLSQRINTRLSKLQSTLLSWWLPPILFDERKVEVWKMYTDEVKRGKLEIKIVSLQPIEEEMVVSSLLDVRPAVRPGFMIIPKDTMYQPVTKARVILHIHGG